MGNWLKNVTKSANKTLHKGKNRPTQAINAQRNRPTQVINAKNSRPGVIQKGLQGAETTARHTNNALGRVNDATQGAASGSGTPDAVQRATASVGGDGGGHVRNAQHANEVNAVNLARVGITGGIFGKDVIKNLLKSKAGKAVLLTALGGASVAGGALLGKKAISDLLTKNGASKEEADKIANDVEKRKKENPDGISEEQKNKAKTEAEAANKKDLNPVAKGEEHAAGNVTPLTKRQDQDINTIRAQTQDPRITELAKANQSLTPEKQDKDLKNAKENVIDARTRFPSMTGANSTMSRNALAKNLPKRPEQQAQGQ